MQKGSPINMSYSNFIIEILGALEPRLYDAGEQIIEAGEEVDEQILFY